MKTFHNALLSADTIISINKISQIKFCRSAFNLFLMYKGIFKFLKISVWVNGQPVGNHSGGHLPFELVRMLKLL